MTDGKKLYLASAYVGNYDLNVICNSPKECIDAIAKAYTKHFGSFRENGFKNKADWLEYHEIDEDSCFEITVGKEWIR